MIPDQTAPDSPTPRSGDRRTQRTRRQLREALMALILEKGYDAVTVEDITSRADLGRTTFYLHYRDKEELLLESIDAIANDIKAQVDFIQTARQAGSSQPRPIHLAFTHAAENAALYRIILKGEGATKTASRLRRFISESAAEFLLARNELPAKAAKPQSSGGNINADSTRLQLVADYFASALLGFLTWWLEADMPYPPDQMADFFIQVFFQGASNELGLPEIRSDQSAAAAASESTPPARSV